MSDAPPDASNGNGRRSISDDEFKQCFDVLQRIGENTRSIVYAFVLIFGTLLIWSLNAIVYPAEQQRLGQVRQNQANIITCLLLMESQEGAKDTLEFKDKCVKSMKDASLDYRVRQATACTHFTRRISNPLNLQGISRSSPSTLGRYQIEKCRGNSGAYLLGK